MSSGQLTSRELTLGYLERIDRLNPLVGAVIENNPNASPSLRSSTASAGRDTCEGLFMASRCC